MNFSFLLYFGKIFQKFQHIEMVVTRKAVIFYKYYLLGGTYQ